MCLRIDQGGSQTTTKPSHLLRGSRTRRRIFRYRALGRRLPGRMGGRARDDGVVEGCCHRIDRVRRTTWRRRNRRALSETVRSISAVDRSGAPGTATPATDGNSALPLPLVLVRARVLVLSTRRLRRRSLLRRAVPPARSPIRRAPHFFSPVLEFRTNTHQADTRFYGSEIAPKSVFFSE